MFAASDPSRHLATKRPYRQLDKSKHGHMFGLLLCRSCRSMKRSRSEWRRYVSKSLDPKTRNTFAQVTLEWPKLHYGFHLRRRAKMRLVKTPDKPCLRIAILDLLLFRYLIYAMQLKRIGVSSANTRRAINDYLADPSSNPKSKPSSFGKQPRSTHSKISACNNFAESETQDSEGCFPS